MVFLLLEKTVWEIDFRVSGGLLHGFEGKLKRDLFGQSRDRPETNRAGLLHLAS